jgi:hypothetical protein
MASVDPPAPAPAPAYGQTKCAAAYGSGVACRNNAYYIDPALGYLCGQHTKSRVKLPALSARQLASDSELRAAQRQVAIDAATCENQVARRGGALKLSRLGRASIGYTPGYAAVFPNNKHQDRKDGFGCCSLSPMRIGPVAHGQPGVPDALNLENFHQYSKQFEGETDSEFAAARGAGYQDPVPHRHKVKGRKPLHAVWLAPDGARHELGAIEARQLYCNFYERGVRGTADFAALRHMLDMGACNLELFGYDAVPMPQGSEHAYLSTEHPFGHERVLFVMLSEPDESAWPWRKHKTLAF